MQETKTLLIFTALLIVSIIFSISLPLTLMIGLILFYIYGLKTDHSFNDLIKYSLRGIDTAKTVILVMALIGVMSGFWRASGTIATIVSMSLPYLSSVTFLAFSFVLCSILSFLTGTSFGTVSTMGIICMIMGKTLGINEVILAGAIISGIYVGDRGSPMSSSCLLVAQVTDTSMVDNLPQIYRRQIVAYILTFLFFLILGFQIDAGETSFDPVAIFQPHLNLSYTTLIPAIVILILAFLKVDLLYIIIVSILTSLGVLIFDAHPGIGELVELIVYGYIAPTKELGQLMNGGGLISMVETILILILSSSYFGIFSYTDLAEPLYQLTIKIYKKTNKFITAAITSFATASLGCNQTLAIMLSSKILEPIYEDKKALALDLEDSVVVISGLIPWSIAATFPLATLGAPKMSLVLSVYIWIIPLWQIVKPFIFKDRSRAENKE